MKSLTNYINEKHTEYCGGSGIGFDMEQVEEAIIDDTITKLSFPKISNLALPLENLRNSDEETADNLLKRAVENWIGAECSHALSKSKKFNVTQSYLETLTVCIELTDNWTDWLK